MARSRRKHLGKFIGAQDKKKSLSYKIDRAQRERIGHNSFLPTSAVNASVNEKCSQTTH